MKFLIRFFLIALSAYIAITLLPNSVERDPPATMAAATALSLFNTYARPSKYIKVFPVTLWSFALILTTLNFVVIKICDRYIPGFDLTNWRLTVILGFVVAAVAVLSDRFIRIDFAGENS